MLHTYSKGLLLLVLALFGMFMVIREHFVSGSRVGSQMWVCGYDILLFLLYAVTGMNVGYGPWADPEGDSYNEIFEKLGEITLFLGLLCGIANLFINLLCEHNKAPSNEASGDTEPLNNT